jgi:hypothetical protein
METPKTLTELRQRLGTGLDVNANVTSSTSDVTWSLLQATAISGSPDMVQLLLDRGADMKFLTHANKSVVDLACEAENWATFELLGKLADNRHSETHAPSPRFYPSKFYLDLQNPIDQEIHNISLIDFEDMITRSRNMSRSGDLANLVPYPSENPHLVGE